MFWTLGLLLFGRRALPGRAHHPSLFRGMFRVARWMGGEVFPERFLGRGGEVGFHKNMHWGGEAFYVKSAALKRLSRNAMAPM